MTNNATPSQDKLLPCPFCGLEPNLTSRFCDTIHAEEHFVECNNDGCFVNPKSIYYSSANGARYSWNDRFTPFLERGEARPMRSDELIDAIREALSLHYDYPRDSTDADTYCPTTHAAFLALDHLYIELKHTREAIQDVRASRPDEQAPSMPTASAANVPSCKPSGENPELAPNAQAIPEGWKLVPKEPTHDMTYPVVGVGEDRSEAVRIYKAMLAAAPSPNESGAG